VLKLFERTMLVVTSDWGMLQAPYIHSHIFHC